MPRSTLGPWPRFAAGGLLLLGGLVAACAPAFPTPTPGGATTTAAPSGGQLGGASPGGPSDSPEPSVDLHGAPELEALLPTEVGKVALTRVSLSGPDFYATGSDQALKTRLDDMLAKLGKTVGDLTVAEAGDPSGIAILQVAAFRVAGANSAQLLTEWVASNQAAAPTRIQVSNETLDGRLLTKLVDTGRPVGGTIRAFVKGDTIYLVDADDITLVSSALAQLPKP